MTHGGVQNLVHERPEANRMVNYQHVREPSVELYGTHLDMLVFHLACVCVKIQEVSVFAVNSRRQK